MKSLSILALAVCTCTTAFAQEAAKWKFEAGQELRYQVTQQTEFQSNAGEAGSFTSHAEQKLDVRWRVDSVDAAGTMTGVQQVERFQVTIRQPSGLELTYDSESTEAPEGLAAMLTPMFETLLATEVPITVTSAGDVTIGELPEEVRKRLAGIPATRAMSELVTESGIRRLAEQIALPVGSGAKRVVTVDNRVLGLMEGTLVWTPTKAEGDIQQFEPALTLEIQKSDTAPEDPYVPVKPMEDAKITEQSTNGSAKFNSAEGRLVESNLAMDLVLTGELMGSDVECYVKQTIEVKEQE
jgi:hypothetical protein